jgi:hypothetical protein
VTDTKAFALCFRNGGGIVTLGGVDPSLHSPVSISVSPEALLLNRTSSGGVYFAEMVKPRGWYTVRLQEVLMRPRSSILGATPTAAAAAAAATGGAVAEDGNRKMGGDVAGKCNGGKGTIVDSGTTDTYLPSALRTHFYSLFKSIAKLEYSNKLMPLTKEQFAKLPVIVFRLQAAGKVGHIDLEVQPSSYMELHKNSGAAFGNPNNVIGGGGKYTPRIYLTENVGAVLGANAINKHNVIFDPDGLRVGFAKSRCAYDKELSRHDFATSTDKKAQTQAKPSSSSSSAGGSSSSKNSVPAKKSKSISDALASVTTATTAEEEDELALLEAVAAKKGAAATAASAGAGAGGEEGHSMFSGFSSFASAFVSALFGSPSSSSADSQEPAAPITVTAVPAPGGLTASLVGKSGTSGGTGGRATDKGLSHGIVVPAGIKPTPPKTVPAAVSLAYTHRNALKRTMLAAVDMFLNGHYAACRPVLAIPCNARCDRPEGAAEAPGSDGSGRDGSIHGLRGQYDLTSSNIAGIQPDNARTGGANRGNNGFVLPAATKLQEYIHVNSRGEVGVAAAYRAEGQQYWRVPACEDEYVSSLTASTTTAGAAGSRAGAFPRDNLGSSLDAGISAVSAGDALAGAGAVSGAVSGAGSSSNGGGEVLEGFDIFGRRLGQQRRLAQWQQQPSIALSPSFLQQTQQQQQQVGGGGGVDIAAKLSQDLLAEEQEEELQAQQNAKQRLVMETCSIYCSVPGVGTGDVPTAAVPVQVNVKHGVATVPSACDFGTHTQYFIEVDAKNIVPPQPSSLRLPFHCYELSGASHVYVPEAAAAGDGTGALGILQGEGGLGGGGGLPAPNCRQTNIVKSRCTPYRYNCSSSLNPDAVPIASATSAATGTAASKRGSKKLASQVVSIAIQMRLKGLQSRTLTLTQQSDIALAFSQLFQVRRLHI